MTDPEATQRSMHQPCARARIQGAVLTPMQGLSFSALILVNIALVVYLTDKGFKWFKGWKQLRRLINNHPEMDGVHPDEDSLFVFETDEMLRALVLDNDEPGSNEPFYASEQDAEHD